MTPPSEDLERTRQSLLVRLRNWEDQASWLEFFFKYWRLIYTVARRSGLSDAEAQDVVQETIIAVCKSIGTFEYQPERCSFRSWLRRLTRQRIIRLVRKKRGQPAWDRLDEADGSMAEGLAEPGETELERIWNEEWERHLMTAACDAVRRQVRAKQFQIFDLYVLEKWPVRRVAETLKVSVTQVYLAKHRVGRLLRKAIQAIDGDRH